MKRAQHKLIGTAILFMAPVLIFMFIFIVYPVVETFHLSLYKWNGISASRVFQGLKNWKELLTDRTFWYACRNNLIIMVLSIVIQIPLGFLLASFLDFAGKKFNIFKVVWFLPHLMSSVAIGFLASYVLATNDGVISTISHLLGGGNIDLLGNSRYALFAVIGVICWQFAPFYMVYFLAAYTNISPELYEAAIIDGATKPDYMVRIALPMMAPAIKSAMILSMVGALKYFDLIYVMTAGGPGNSTELMATYMYKLSFSNFNMGYGSTVAGGMFIIITLMSLITMKLMNRGGEE